MTEKENLMYKVIASISESDTPLVFKGGLITKLILSENNFDKIERMTKDIDASWTGKPPEMQYMVKRINSCLKNINGDYKAVAVREYGENRSAGISIIESSTGNEIASMDIDVKPSLGEKKYFIGEASIKGVLVDEILMDKISALSGRMPFRRTKDMVDIYALTHCVEVKTSNIFMAFENAGRVCGDFIPFVTRTEDMKHSYEKLNIVRGKPSFDEISDYLGKFLKPFLQNDFRTDKTWNSRTEEWTDSLEITRKANNNLRMGIKDWKAEISRERLNVKEKPDSGNMTKQKTNLRNER